MQSYDKSVTSDEIATWRQTIESAMETAQACTAEVSMLRRLCKQAADDLERGFYDKNTEELVAKLRAAGRGDPLT